jgi:formylglycine-generating enzyme required for sulfatase activity
MQRAVLFSFLLLAAAFAQDRRVQPIVARKQVALVIGNAVYSNRPLANSVRDAQAVARRLRELNFDVALTTDAGRKAMGLAIDQFVNKLGTGDVAFFYYSGHGVQVEGENYLIPTDYQGQSETDVRYDAHPAGRIQERMERTGAQLNILVLDACRDNPYHSGSRGLGGLAAMTAGRGTYIVFATSPGRTASDSGLFARSLVQALSVRGLGLNDVFDMVRERVDAASGGKQLPWTLSSVVGRYSFLPSAPPPVERGQQVRDSKVNPADGQRYVWIPPGTFQMGCSPGDSECDDQEKPAHQVTLTKGFWMGRTPVTVGAFKRYAQATGNPMPREKDSFGRVLNAAAGNDSWPVVFVTWHEAAGFCGWAGMRVPSEAEWEYAARASTTAARYGNLDDIAWYGDNSGKQRIDSTATWNADSKNFAKRLYENGNGPKPVGQKQPNAFGLYDMLGNVWQWTADWYDDKYYQASERQDPPGPPSGTRRVVRGASWRDPPKEVRISTRHQTRGGVFSPAFGFRCVGE